MDIESRLEKEDLVEELLTCPFCGSDPKIKFIGNDYTKTRKVEIKCSNAFCSATIIKGGIRANHKQVASWVIEIWNKRI